MTFIDKLQEAAAAASRSANAHNTQPWELRDRGDCVEVGWRPEYALGPSDPAHRDLRLSLGSYVETLLICCSHVGLAVEFKLDFDVEATRVGFLLPTELPYVTSFRASDVAGRRVWRGRWSPQPVSEASIEAAQEIAQEAGFRVAVLSTAIARPLLTRAYHWFFAHPGIAAELRAWSRLHPRHPDYHSDGLNDIMLVLNRAKRFAMRLVFTPSVYRLLRPIGLSRLLAPLSSNATSGDGVVLVVLGKGNDVAREIDAGRLIARLWLGFLQQGVYVYPQSHVIDCPNTVHELAERCGARDGERPLVFFRVGLPALDPALRPRHPRRD